MPTVLLHDLLDGLAQRPEVLGAAVVSDEGLVIEQALAHHLDAEALAALATTLLRHGSELGVSGGLGPLGVAVFDFATGPAILAALEGGASLLLLTRDDVNIGELLYTVRMHRATIASLL